MTAPLRRFLLNKEIAMEARRIAHGATKSCIYVDDEAYGDSDDEHTPNCNKLKHTIEALAMQVKLASVQRAQERKQDDERRDLLVNNIKGENGS
jgi:hypothetical protein